jgi:hypothetical protein
MNERLPNKGTAAILSGPTAQRGTLLAQNATQLNLARAGQSFRGNVTDPTAIGIYANRNWPNMVAIHLEVHGFQTMAIAL